jgi:hypothetical protein
MATGVFSPRREATLLTKHRVEALEMLQAEVAAAIHRARADASEASRAASQEESAGVALLPHDEATAEDWVDELRELTRIANSAVHSVKTLAAIAAQLLETAKSEAEAAHSSLCFWLRHLDEQEEA